MDTIKSAIIGLLATVFCIWLLRPIASRIGLVDRPDSRKWHKNDVPVIGGIAIFFGFCLSLLTLKHSLFHYRGMLAGSAILILMGVVDDIKDLSFKLRLLGQIFSVLLMIIWGNVMIENLGNLLFFGDIHIGLWGVPFTIIVVMANINAMNMIDGQDGLASGVALIQTVLLIVLVAKLGSEFDLKILVIFAVLIATFLFFNVRPLSKNTAKIFMGDAGSTFLAYILSWFVVDLSQHGCGLMSPMTVLWIVAFPIYDLVNVTILRIRQKKSVMLASRDHFHHVLHLLGINSLLSTILLCLLSLILGLLGLLLNYIGLAEGWQLLMWVMFLVIYVIFVEITRKPSDD